MPVVEQRNPRDGLILAIGCGAAAVLALAAALLFGLALPMQRTVVTTGITAGSSPATGSGSWGSGTVVGASLSAAGTPSYTHSFVPTEVPNPAARVTAITLEISGQHARPEDLEVVLVAPDGTREWSASRGRPASSPGPIRQARHSPR